MEAHLAVEPPFRFDLALQYLATSPSRIAELVTETTFGRAFRTPGGSALALVDVEGDGLRVRVRGPGANSAALASAVTMTERVFSLKGDGAGAAVVADRDPLVAPLIARYLGLRPLTIPDPFEAIAWAILGQQINVGFAATMKRALIGRYGEAVEIEGQPFLLFPSPERLIDITVEEGRALQISRQKTTYIRDVARAVCDGVLALEDLRHQPDAVVIDTLTRLNGVGVWTAEYLLLRGLGRPDAIPAGDMGIRALLGRLRRLGRNATEAEVREQAEVWRPWRGYLGFMLWFALQRKEFGG